MSTATRGTMADCQTLSRPTMAGPRGVAASIAHAIGVWRTRIRDRRRFATLDSRELRDLGLSNWEVERELAKPFWRG
jgi:uncharacterized protein YjiS (DUF1127 family)